MSRSEKTLAIVIAVVLVAGIAVAGVRGSRTTERAGPVPSTSLSPSETGSPSETSPTPSATTTPSPSASPTPSLPITGDSEAILPLAALMIGLALGGSVLLARAR